MRTVGEILKKARVEKHLTFEEIENTTKIRKKFLVALEENDWEHLPSLPYIKGFIRSYSSFLGLKPDEMVAIFRRHFKDQDKIGLLPSGLTHPLDETSFRLTPQVTLIGIAVVFLFLFFGYLFFQYKSYTSPPNLEITKPLEGEVLQTGKIDVIGKTDADAVISVNNQKIALSPTGEFTTTLLLSPGVNVITIESTSKYGKKKTITRTVQVAENSETNR